MMADIEFNFENIRNKMRSSLYQTRLWEPAKQLDSQKALNALIHDFQIVFKNQSFNVNPIKRSTTYSPQITMAVLGPNKSLFYPIQPTKRHQHAHLPTDVTSSHRNIDLRTMTKKKKKIRKTKKKS